MTGSRHENLVYEYGLTLRMLRDLLEARVVRGFKVQPS